MRSLRWVGLAAVAAVAGCAPTETLFQSNFDSTAVGAPPAPVQAVGTASIFGGKEDVTVQPAPAGSSGNWLRVTRDGPQSPISGMIGTFSAARGAGKYHFSGVMYIPAGLGLASLSFLSFQTDSSGNPLEIMHVDFGHRSSGQPDVVQVNDSAGAVFGTFQRSTPFDVFVTLDTTVNPATADISLVGSGASGSLHYVLSDAGSIAAGLDRVEVWAGFPWVGTFQSTSLLVTHDTP